MSLGLSLQSLRLNDILSLNESASESESDVDDPDSPECIVCRGKTCRASVRCS